MKIQKLVLVLFFFSLTFSSSFARKPAVEDFVGVEPESYERTPQGTEVLFEFGNTVKAFEPASPSPWVEWTPAFVLASFLLLPFLMWFGITRTVKKELGEVEEPGNVAKLSDYKKAKEEEKDDYKKVS